jgi:hypothetical protein
MPRVLINCLCACLTILHNALHGLLVWCMQQEIDLLKVSFVVFMLYSYNHISIIFPVNFRKSISVIFLLIRIFRSFACFTGVR